MVYLIAITSSDNTVSFIKVSSDNYTAAVQPLRSMYNSVRLTERDTLFTLDAVKPIRRLDTYLLSVNPGSIPIRNTNGRYVYGFQAMEFNGDGHTIAIMSLPESIVKIMDTYFDITIDEMKT